MSRWMGKSWAALGDSITEANGYQPYVTAELGFAVAANYGRSGCPMTAGGDRDSGATVNVGREIRERYDCVTIFAGTNDYRLNRPLGDPGSRDIYTFIGAYTVLIERLLCADPACRVSLWTPLMRDKDGYDCDRPNDAGHRLPDYAEAVRELGCIYALPVLDLYAESGLNKLTLPYFTTDGLHPNEKGFERIGRMVSAFLGRL
jgi:lysophospholipase L1-like esterase